MTADVSRHMGLEFPPFPPDTTERMTAIVGERVTVANPFDMHTYLWFQHAALRRLFDEVYRSDVDAVGFTLDCPPARAPTTRRTRRDRAVRGGVPRRQAARRVHLVAAGDDGPHVRQCACEAASCRCRASARRSRRWTSPALSARLGAGHAAELSMPLAAGHGGDDRRRRRQGSARGLGLAGAAFASRALRAGVGARRPRSAFRSSSRRPAPGSSTRPNSAASCSACAPRSRPMRRREARGVVGRSAGRADDRRRRRRGPGRRDGRRAVRPAAADRFGRRAGGILEGHGDAAAAVDARSRRSGARAPQGGRTARGFPRQARRRRAGPRRRDPAIGRYAARQRDTLVELDVNPIIVRPRGSGPSPSTC